MFLPLLMLLLGADIATSYTIEDCPPEVARDEYLQVYGDFCYQFVLYRKRNYPDAEKDCEAEGGTLVTVSSGDIQDYLTSQILDNYNYTYYEKIWIGLNDIEEEGTLVWEDGSSLEYTNWATYANLDIPWLTKAEDCVAMDLGIHGQWRHYSCEMIYTTFGFYQLVTYAYVCQYAIM